MRQCRCGSARAELGGAEADGTAAADTYLQLQVAELRADRGRELQLAADRENGRRHAVAAIADGSWGFNCIVLLLSLSCWSRGIILEES